LILRHTSGGEQVSFHGKPEVVIPVGEELYILDAVEAQADPDTAVVCAFGDSIIEGVNIPLMAAILGRTCFLGDCIVLMR
jgi:hypothetical protein